jgi:hypothetical protein
MKNSIAVSRFLKFFSRLAPLILVIGCEENGAKFSYNAEPNNAVVQTDKYPGETKEVGGISVVFRQDPISSTKFVIEGPEALVRDGIHISEADVFGFVSKLERDKGWHRIFLLIRGKKFLTYTENLEKKIEAISPDVDAMILIHEEKR